jgi:hypothetical protein
MENSPAGKEHSAGKALWKINGKAEEWVARRQA